MLHFAVYSCQEEGRKVQLGRQLSQKERTGLDTSLQKWGAAAQGQLSRWLSPSKGACGKKVSTGLATVQCSLESRVCTGESQLFIGSGFNFSCDGKVYKMFGALWNSGLRRLLKAYLEEMEHWMACLYLAAAWGPNSTCKRSVSGQKIAGLSLHQEWLHKHKVWPLWKQGITWNNFPDVWSLRSEPQKCLSPGVWRNVRSQPGAAQSECPTYLVTAVRQGLQTGLHIVQAAAQYSLLYLGWKCTSWKHMATAHCSHDSN